MCLTDTNGAEDLHLNDVLVKEGHAMIDIAGEEDHEVSSFIVSGCQLWSSGFNSSLMLGFLGLFFLTESQ